MQIFIKMFILNLKKDYIDTGLAKIEFRHFPLDIAAFNAAKIAQCKSDQSLEILESLYSNQQAWVKGNTIEDINKNLKKYLKMKVLKLILKNVLITNKLKILF